MTPAELRALVDAATPGPWEVFPGFSSQQIRSTDGHVTLIAETMRGYDPERRESNANLIALAPTLALLAADMAGAMYRLDHSDDECRGECLVERRLIYEDFRPLVSRLAALGPASEPAA